MQIEWIYALVGGVLIGLSVSGMLIWNGRVTGISGIMYGLLNPNQGDRAWRLYFLLGLLFGGTIYQFFRPAVFGSPAAADWTAAVAGLFVGFGTVLGSGCTSGHGVCGISRLSPRSMVATVLFIVSGFLSVLVLKKIGVLP